MRERAKSKLTDLVGPLEHQLADLTRSADAYTKTMTDLSTLLNTIMKITEHLDTVSNLHASAKHLQEEWFVTSQQVASLLEHFHKLKSSQVQHTTAIMDYATFMKSLGTLVTGIENIYEQIQQMAGVLSTSNKRRFQLSSNDERSSSSSNEPQNHGSNTSIPMHVASNESYQPSSSASASLSNTESPVSSASTVMPITPITTTALPMSFQNIHGIINPYGINVLKRVMCKLEGKDPNSQQKVTVVEQVAWVIQEATAENNLATMYEGWTP